MYSNVDEAFDTTSRGIWNDDLTIVEVSSIEGVMKNNFVMIEVDDFVYDIVKINTGNSIIDLKVDNEYTVYKYIVKHGTIKNTPDRLIFYDQDKQIGLPWKTELTIKEGDIVWFSGMMSKTCEKITFNGRKFLLMNYEDLYAVKRGEEVICLNGNVILRTITKKEGFGAYQKEVLDTSWAVVEHIGSPCYDYLNESKIDDSRIQKGMKVFIGGVPLRKLEHSPYLFFDGKNEYFVCQNNEIKGYVE